MSLSWFSLVVTRSQHAAEKDVPSSRDSREVNRVVGFQVLASTEKLPRAQFSEPLLQLVRSPWKIAEVTMPFSLGSYLLGVGTVVGALAFGFSGGVLLTKTAMKDTAAGSTRVERVARSEPEPAAPAEQQQARENPTPPAEPAFAAPPDPRPADQVANVATTPRSDARGESAKQPEPAKQAEPANPAEQKDAMQKRSAERKVERQRHAAEPKARAFAASRTRQPPSEEQDRPERTGPERTEFAYGREESGFFGREEPRVVRREESRFGLFRMFGRPPLDRSIDRAPADRDDD
jgi:hypothetical protein